MMYIQLSRPYSDFDKVKIKNFYLYESSVSVTYVVFGTKALFEKTFNITSEESEFSEFLEAQPNERFSIVDNFHKLLLEYMIKKNIETGTLEVK